MIIEEMKTFNYDRVRTLKVNEQKSYQKQFYGIKLNALFECLPIIVSFKKMCKIAYLNLYNIQIHKKSFTPKSTSS
ncbi:MAG TPA: hypothetical protein DDX37_02535 [Candidatus Omnitrophica bacterium]|nr:hypothetical protein [Candidatus Omnitrophota bacterium]